MDDQTEQSESSVATPEIDGSSPLGEPKWELFALRIVQGGVTASQAYRESGYKATARAVGASASRLLARPDVQARIHFLKQAAAEKVMLTQAGVIQRFIQVYDTALADRAFEPAIESLLKAADYAGIYPGVNREAERPGEVAPLVNRLEAARHGLRLLEAPRGVTPNGSVANADNLA